MTTLPLTVPIIRFAGLDTGNRSMRRAGRKEWARADWDAACAEFDRLAAFLRQQEISADPATKASRKQPV